MIMDVTPWVNLILLLVLGALVGQTFSTLRQVGRDVHQIKEELVALRKDAARIPRQEREQ